MLYFGVVCYRLLLTVYAGVSFLAASQLYEYPIIIKSTNQCMYQYILQLHTKLVIQQNQITLQWRQITSLTIVYSTVYSGADHKNIKAPRHWPLCREFTGERWIPRTNGQ